MVHINIEIDDATHKVAKIKALEKDMSLKDYISEAISDKLKGC